MPRQRRGGKNVKRSVPDISSSDGESGDELPTAPPAKKQRTISLPGCIRYWSIGSCKGNAERFVSVSKFKGAKYVNIREYFENADGELLPSKKGITLTLQQASALLKCIGEAVGVASQKSATDGDESE